MVGAQQGAEGHIKETASTSKCLCRLVQIGTNTPQMRMGLFLHRRHLAAVSGNAAAWFELVRKSLKNLRLYTDVNE